MLREMVIFFSRRPPPHHHSQVKRTPAWKMTHPQSTFEQKADLYNFPISPERLSVERGELYGYEWLP